MTTGPLSAIITWPLRMLIRAYQLVPKAGPPRCRFLPSCSQYALEALERHGIMRGAALAAWRLARCHPFNPGGLDPVPAAGARRAD